MPLMGFQKKKYLDRGVGGWVVFKRIVAQYMGHESIVARWPSGLGSWLRMATGHSRPGSNPISVKTFRFGTLAIPFTPLCQCLSDETLKAVSPFYLVSMPGEVKDPTSPHWNV